MADISAEIAAFKNAVYGEDVRDAMVSLANKLNTVITSMESTSFIFRGGIGSTDDLNNVVTMGTYICGSSSGVPANTPTEVTMAGFIIIVFYTYLAGYGDYRCQMLIVPNTDIYWRFRGSTATAWRPWNKLARENYVDNLFDSINNNVKDFLTERFELANNYEYEDMYIDWVDGFPPDVSQTATRVIKSNKIPVDDDMVVYFCGTSINNGVAIYDEDDNLIDNRYLSDAWIGRVFYNVNLLVSNQKPPKYIILYKNISASISTAGNHGHVLYSHKKAIIEPGIYKNLVICGGYIHSGESYSPAPRGYGYRTDKCVNNGGSYDCFIDRRFSPNSIITFDDTKVKLLILFGDENDNNLNRSFWHTSSPCDVMATYSNLASAAHHIRFAFRKVDNNEDINFADSVSVIVKNNLSSQSLTGDNVCVYLSSNGSDTNTGLTNTAPVKTLSKAMSIGKNIIIMSGIYTDRCPSWTGKITIKKFKDTGKVVFVDPSRILATSATKVSGYNNIYQITTSSTISGEEIYQENVPDVTTLISDNERHPCQRGKEYRCDDTKIILCSSTTLSNALNEIENASTYKYYVDDTTLYFSSPQIIDSNHPLIRLTGAGWFSSASQSQEAKLIGLEFKGYCLNLHACGAGATAIDCRVGQILNAGCFIWNSSIAVTLIRCEAYRANSGTTTGDGFNAHADTTGTADAKKCTCMLIDCWSHDNHDDGYSDHECGEINIYGGLFEHNKKAGITPSYGTHCVCHDVYSRNNYRGFAYVGPADDGGKYGQLAMYNCIAENNSVNGVQVTGEGNRLIAYNSTTINNPIGWYCGEDTLMRLINCYSENDTAKISAVGTLTIEIPELLTPSLLDNQ